jgi:hypothetical protein
LGKLGRGRAALQLIFQRVERRELANDRIVRSYRLWSLAFLARECALNGS